MSIDIPISLELNCVIPPIKPIAYRIEGVLKSQCMILTSTMYAAVLALTEVELVVDLVGVQLGEPALRAILGQEESFRFGL